MKEYLMPSRNYEYILTDAREALEPHAKDWISIPEGANYAYNNDQGVLFLNSELGHNHPSLLWQRHTQPEELPFMDSLNDQYAEIEQVRQNVFKATDFSVSGLPELKHDFVNHPKHYCDHPSGIECIEITRHHDFAIGNAIKYLWRAGLKDSDNEIQDLKKAVWYIQDKIAQLENK